MPFMGELLQSTAITKTVLVVDSADHITGKTGLAAGITKYLTKAGGTPTAATMTTAELDATNTKGVYSLAFTTTHTNTLGDFQLHLTGTGADPSDYWWTVVAVTLDGVATAAAVAALNNLSQANVRTAVGLASADLDTQLSGINSKTTNLPGSPSAVGSAMTLTSGERTSIADALLDETAGVETGLTLRQYLRLSASALFAIISGAATSTVVFRNFGNTKDRITAIVDADGNRSAVTTDAT